MRLKFFLRTSVCLLAALLGGTLAGCSQPSESPQQISGQLTVSFSGNGSSFSLTDESGQIFSAATPEESVWDTVAQNAAGPVITSLIKPDIFSNGVGLRTFISRVIEIALQQPQYPVKDGKTVYGELFGAPKAQWCTEFCMYCLRQAEDELGTEFIGDVYPWRDSAWDTGIWFKKRGRYYDAGDDYRPSKGDLIIFDTQNLGYPNHTGMVIDVTEQNGQITVHTIEGNIPEDEVKQIRSRTLAVDDPIILGYCSTTQTHEYTGSLVDYTY